MRKAMACTHGLAALTLAVFGSAAGAQDTMRVRGTIERLDGPIYVVMRLYWPKETPPSILPPGEGPWNPPGILHGK